jgi:hypothetical protein
MGTITIDTQGNEALEREAEELRLPQHKLRHCAEDAQGRAVWQLDPDSKGMVINFDPGIFNAREDEGVVAIERTS